MYRNQYLSTVLAPQGFVLLCTSVRCESHRPLCGASLQRLCASVYCTSSESFCAVRAYKGFIQRAPGLVLLCTVRALARCEPTKVCASVCRTSARSFARCEPTKALCLCVPYERQEICAVRASKGFVPLCAVRASRALCGASLQRLSTVCWCSPLMICYVLVYKNLYICTVRAHTIFVVLYGNLYACMSRNGAFTWTSTPACVFQTPAVKNYIIGTVVKT